MSQSTLQSVSGAEKGYTDLKNYFANINTMFSVRNILAVDMMTAMPPGGVQQRLQDISSITKRIYAETTAPSVTALLAEVEQKASELSAWDQANVREMRRIHTHLAALPPNLYVAAVRVSNEGRRQHKAALENKDWETASVYLQQVVDLYRNIAGLKQKAFGAASPYEALLKGYAGDLTEAQVEALYEKLSAPLVALREDILAQQGEGGALSPLPNDLDRVDQLSIGRDLAHRMGFDSLRGTLMPTASSPYAGGTRNDVRVLIRCESPNDAYASFKDTLYQGARALYTQHLPEDWDSQPVGQNLGALIMNAVSLLYESVVGRTPEFLDFMASRSPAFDRTHMEATRRQVRTSVTRDRADEISKISHDIIRYRIEKDLISGTIDVKDIPDRWAAESKALLGVEPADVTEGPLQNPDWFTGRFGFIPTNTLSHIIAVSLFNKIEQVVPNAKAKIKDGDLAFINDFLVQHVFSKGRSEDAIDLMEQLVGQPLNQDHLLAHFKARYVDGVR